ncbi:MAG: bifunctional riboflavin kinase/FAD synthetase [Bacilli bacterium]
MKVKYADIQSLIIQEPRALCIGFFDGVHLGHQALIKETVRLATEAGITASMLTFAEPPRSVVSGHKQPLITDNETKIKLVESFGISEIIVVEFDRDIMSLSAEDFIHKFLKPFEIKELICGFDFTFGKNGSGTADSLVKMQDLPFNVHVIPAVNIDGAKVASSRIVDLIQKGEIKEANALLGYTFAITGKVIHGLKNGQELGYPTANLALKDYVHPKNGVYASRIIIGNQTYYGMSNVGVRPTISLVKEPLLEVNIFDFKHDLYGKKIEVQLLDFIREEQKYANKCELQAQLSRDKERIMSCISTLK